jgi:hypothetical protein
MPIARVIRDLEDMGNGKLALSVRCLRYRHKAVLLPMSLAMLIGTNYPLERMYRRLRCPRCERRRENPSVKRPDRPVAPE